MDELNERALRARREVEGISGVPASDGASIIWRQAHRRRARRTGTLLVTGMAVVLPTMIIAAHVRSSAPTTSAGVFAGADDATNRTSRGEVRPGPVPRSTACSQEPLPFHATYVPPGWNGELQVGELRDYKADGSYSTETTKSWNGPAGEAVSVFRDSPGIEPPKDPEPVSILGGRGEIGFYPSSDFGAAEKPVISAAFSWCGSRWSLVGTGGASLDEVRKMAEGFVPGDS